MDGVTTDGPTGGPGSGDASLGEEERRDVSRRVAPRAVVVYEAVRLEGESELRRPASSLWWSGVAAGLSMGFSLVAEGLLRVHLPEAPWRALIEKAGYAFGFLIVVLGRQQLFTENTLTAVLPLLARPTWPAFRRLLRLWAIVLLANLAGALAFAALVAFAGPFPADTGAAFAAIGREAVGSSFGGTFVEAVLAGWLIALMVWLLPAAEASRITVVVLITWLIGIGGLAHVVAGSVTVLYAVLAGAVSSGEYLGRFLVPSLAGNVVGGVALVALLNHAQVAADRDRRPPP